MTDKKKFSFSKFVESQPVNEVLLPTGVVDKPEDKELIPNLFCTIHHKSDERPNGWDDDSLFWANHDANSHIPSLQKAMREQRRADGHTDVKDESEYE